MCPSPSDFSKNDRRTLDHLLLLYILDPAAVQWQKLRQNCGFNKRTMMAFGFGILHYVYSVLIWKVPTTIIWKLPEIWNMIWISESSALTWCPCRYAKWAPSFAPCEFLGRVLTFSTTLPMWAPHGQGGPYCTQMPTSFL